MLPKREPQRAWSSTGDFEHPMLNSEQSVEQSLKARFRRAYDQWKGPAGGTQESFADELGVDYVRVKGWFSDNRYRPVPLSAVTAAERLAQAARPQVPDAEYRRRLEEYVRAHDALLELGRTEAA